MSTGEVYHSSYATLPDGKNDSRLSTEELIKGVPAGTGILIVAHPGHELRMHGWLQAVHPTTCVLTDGSGHSGQSRLASTSKVLEDVDAKIGALYGRLTDMQLYEAVLDLDHRLFIELASELSDALITEQVDYVVGDRAEGYNPGHDVCRLLIDAAIEAARQRHHKEIANFDFTLIGSPNEGYDEYGQSIQLSLSSTALVRKIEAALNYQEMADEVNSALSKHGQEAFAIECLCSVSRSQLNSDYFNLSKGERPFYETHGERQVAAGFYQRVLRLREHIIPLAEALNDWVNNLSLVSDERNFLSIHLAK